MDWSEFKETEEGKALITYACTAKVVTNWEIKAIFEAGQANSPDTARLDYLIKNDADVMFVKHDKKWVCWTYPDGRYGDTMGQTYYGDTPREAIDAAMGEHDEH